uniref:GRIP domain-containing protein n=1 Tax=Ditylenchus dipsaci TaxID=166011 RepID=A0A915E3D1_9BILA
MHPSMPKDPRLYRKAIPLKDICPSSLGLAQQSTSFNGTPFFDQFKCLPNSGVVTATSACFNIPIPNPRQKKVSYPEKKDQNAENFYNQNASLEKATYPENKDKTIEQLNRKNASLEKVIKDWKSVNKNGEKSFNRRIKPTGLRFKCSKLPAMKRDYRKEIDRLRALNANQLSQFETDNQVLQNQLQAVQKELENHQKELADLKLQGNTACEAEETIRKLQHELGVLKGSEITCDVLQNKLDSKEKILKTSMDRIELLEEQLKEASNQLALHAQELINCNVKCLKAEQEAENWKLQHRKAKEEEEVKKSKPSTTDSYTNTDVFDLTPAHLQHCIDQTIELHKELKKVCEETKQGNALLVKERQDMKQQEDGWNNETENLKQLCHTTKGHLEKCMADLRSTEDRLLEESQQHAKLQVKYKQLEKTTLQQSFPSVIHSSVLPPSMETRKRPFVSKPLSRRAKKRRRLEAASPRATLSSALNYLPSSSGATIDDSITISDDEQEMPEAANRCSRFAAILNSVTKAHTLQQATPTPFKFVLDTSMFASQENRTEVRLPETTPNFSFKRPPNEQSSSTIHQPHSLENLADISESASQEILLSSSEEAAAQNQSSLSESKISESQPCAFLDTHHSSEQEAQIIDEATSENDQLMSLAIEAEFSMLDSQTKSAKERVARRPTGDPERIQTKESPITRTENLEEGDQHVICQTASTKSHSRNSRKTLRDFVIYLQKFDKSMPAHNAIIPFCDLYNVPEQDRPQLFTQLIPIALDFRSKENRVNNSK